MHFLHATQYFIKPMRKVFPLLMIICARVSAMYFAMNENEMFSSSAHSVGYIVGAYQMFVNKMSV